MVRSFEGEVRDTPVAFNNFGKRGHVFCVLFKWNLIKALPPRVMFLAPGVCAKRSVGIVGLFSRIIILNGRSCLRDLSELMERSGCTRLVRKAWSMSYPMFTFLFWEDKSVEKMDEMVRDDVEVNKVIKIIPLEHKIVSIEANFVLSFFLLNFRWVLMTLLETAFKERFRKYNPIHVEPPLATKS